MADSKPLPVTGLTLTTLEDTLAGRTPGLIRAGTIHLMPMEEMGLGEGANENNSRILVGGRGEGGVPHLHTAGRPKFSSASLRAKHTKAPAQRSAYLPPAPICPPERTASDQRADPTGPSEGPWGKCPGNPSLQEAMLGTGVATWFRAPAWLPSLQPAYKPIIARGPGGGTGRVCAFLLL